MLFEPPFGGFRGNVCTLSIPHWKAHRRYHIVIIEFVLLSLTVQTL